MPKQQLRELLEALRRELGKAQRLDEDTRQRLDELRAKIEAALRQSDAASPSGTSLVEPVQQFVDEFETSHPQLTMTLGRIADLLNKLGI